MTLTEKQRSDVTMLLIKIHLFIDVITTFVSALVGLVNLLPTGSKINKKLLYVEQKLKDIRSVL